MRLREDEMKTLETYRFSSEAADVSSSMLLARLLNDDGQLAKYVAHVRAEMGGGKRRGCRFDARQAPKLFGADGLIRHVGVEQAACARS